MKKKNSYLTCPKQQGLQVWIELVFLSPKNEDVLISFKEIDK
jgi:hypothetical protein